MDDPLRRIVDPVLNGANKFLSTQMKTGPNGTTSSAAVFSRYIPRTIDTTVGDEIGQAAMNLGGPALVSGLATRTVPTILGLAGGVAGSEVGNELAGPAGGFLGALLGGAGGYKMGERIPIRWGTPKTPAVKPVIKTLAEADPVRAAELRAKGLDPEKIPVELDENGNITHVDYSNYTTEKPFISGDGLSQAQIEKGWKKEKNVFISPKGDRFVRDRKTGRLISEASLKTRKDIEK